MLLKPGKAEHEVDSYPPISLLPILYKLFEKLLLKNASTNHWTTAFVDDTAVLASVVNQEVASAKLQWYLDEIEIWLRK